MHRTLPILASCFVAAAAFSAASAAAETREQAVAYAFLGLADGATLDRGPVHLAWKEISSSPAVFQGHGEGGGKKYDVRFVVTATGDCNYEIRLMGPPNMVRDGDALFATIDVTEISAVAPAEFNVQVTGDGYCLTGTTNPNCAVVHEADIFGTIDAAKQATMLAQVRADACMKP